MNLCIEEASLMLHEAKTHCASFWKVEGKRCVESKKVMKESWKFEKFLYNNVQFIVTTR